MSAEAGGEELARAITRALESAAEALLTSIPSGAVTAIVVERSDLPYSLHAVPALVAALERAGLRRGRSFVLVGRRFLSPDPEPLPGLREIAGLPLQRHDPDRSPCFRAGVTSLGVEVELDDELREAEAVITVGEVRTDPLAGFAGGHHLLFPGLASRRACAAHEALKAGGDAAVASDPASADPDAGNDADRNAHEAASLVGIDLQLCWIRAGAGASRSIAAWAGRGDQAVREARAALLAAVARS